MYVFRNPSCKGPGVTTRARTLRQPTRNQPSFGGEHRITQANEDADGNANTKKGNLPRAGEISDADLECAGEIDDGNDLECTEETNDAEASGKLKVMPRSPSTSGVKKRFYVEIPVHKRPAILPFVKPYTGCASTKRASLSTSSAEVPPSSFAPSSSPADPIRRPLITYSKLHPVRPPLELCSEIITSPHATLLATSTLTPSTIEPTLHDFLSSLRTSCINMLDSLLCFGIHTVDNLDVFYRNIPANDSFHYHTAREYFPNSTAYQWMVIGIGLDQRRLQSREKA